MRDRDAQLRRGERARERRVRVAVHEYGVGRLAQQQRFERHQHAPRHVAMAAAVNAEMMGRRVHRELVEENRRHAGVEVLARMHDPLLDMLDGAHRARNRARLDELGARAEHGHDLHVSPSGAACPAATASSHQRGGLGDRPHRAGAPAYSGRAG